jgi:acetyltransferase-like isoleucine patch superfamily enzyme
VTWARSLPRPLRAAAATAVHHAWSLVCDLGAIGPDDARGRRFGGFGRGSVLAFPQGALFNEDYIRIGEGTMVGPYVSLSAGMAPGQRMASDPVVKIGDRCVIGRGSHIVGHWQVELGDDIQTGPYVYITDQNHSYRDPDEPIGRQWPVEAPVRIGSGSWLGAHVVILPGTVLGTNVVVAAGAVVRGEFPGHCVLAGVPARMVRRWEPSEGWVDGDEGWGEGARPTADGPATEHPLRA